MTEVVLHDYWRSSASYRVRIALGLKGVPFTATSVDLLAGAQKQADHVALNPQGLVPALEIDGLVLAQSLAIMDYLDETRPTPPLLPEAPQDRARIPANGPCNRDGNPSAKQLGRFGSSQDAFAGSGRGPTGLDGALDAQRAWLRSKHCSMPRKRADSAMAMHPAWPTFAWCRRSITCAGGGSTWGRIPAPWPWTQPAPMSRPLRPPIQTGSSPKTRAWARAALVLSQQRIDLVPQPCQAVCTVQSRASWESGAPLMQTVDLDNPMQRRRTGCDLVV